MVHRFWILSLVIGTSLNLPPCYSQDKEAPSAKPAAEESETAKARRDRLAAEVKKKNSQSESVDATTKESATTKTKVKLVRLSGSYVDFNEALSIDPTTLLLGSVPTKQKSFYKFCEFIDDLAKNDSLSWVVFDISDPSFAMNPAQLEEATRRLAKLKASGKRLIAWLENASNEQLLIAATCDEILMADFGGVDFPSASMQSVFYREAMDLLGIKASVVRAGDFKGAVEPFMNAQMSEHLRSHYLDMLSSINDARVSMLAKGRGLTVADVREIQKKRFLLPQEAVTRGLVDRLAPYGSMKETIDRMIDKPTEWIEPTKKTEKDMSFFEVMSTIMAGPKKNTARVKDPSIAVLHLSGVIQDGKEESPGAIVDGPIVKSIESLIEDEKVQAVVVRINSPGGSATASESIRQALKKLADKKPTIVSMGELAASGGYWVSCFGVPVYAERGTVTGSIGVFSLKLSFGSLMRRIGVHMETIALDNSAAVFSLEKPWSEVDESVLQETIDDVYQRFLRLVSKSRGMTVEQVEPLAGGRVWSGTQAKSNGLIDNLGGLDDALDAIAKKAKLEKYKVIHRPEPSTGLDLFQLLGESDEDEILMRVLSKEAIDMLQGSGFKISVLRTIVRATSPLTKGRPVVWALHPADLNVR
ncbi:MAG: signal peptide peptidase SppA [Pirellulaceae bacterium]|nr:signal peptide peptidase SppA [Pirellulaceae bacterium]